VAAGGISPLYSLYTLFLSSLEYRCAGCSDCGGCWLSCCPVLNTAAPIVQTAGECWCICESVYRGPSRGPCIGTIYPTLLGFGGIHHIILSYIYRALNFIESCKHSVPVQSVLVYVILSSESIGSFIYKCDMSIRSIY